MDTYGLLLIFLGIWGYGEDLDFLGGFGVVDVSGFWRVRWMEGASHGISNRLKERCSLGRDNGTRDQNIVPSMFLR